MSTILNLQFFDECNGVDHASVPRKLRSGILFFFSGLNLEINHLFMSVMLLELFRINWSLVLGSGSFVAFFFSLVNSFSLFFLFI